jgi:hypothetical protein
MNIESRSTREKIEIDQIEAKLRSQGYRQVPVASKLNPGEYYKNEWKGIANSFEGQSTYHIEWCKKD